MSPKPTPRNVPTATDDEPSRAIAVQLPLAVRRYSRSPMRWRPGCEVTVLRDGHATFPSMLAAIVAARTSIVLEIYILAADATGDAFRVALLDRTRAGVAVRISYDAVGSFGLSDGWFDELRNAGAQIVAFNPIAQWRRKFNLSHRDHRKILVIDDEVAFTGGLNLADDYASVEDGGRGWHDMHCRVRGPIVRDLSRLFRRGWIRAGGAPYAIARRDDGAPEPPAVGKAYVRMLANTKLRERAKIRRAYLHVIKAARSSVLIQNAYFLPDRGLRRALGRAAQRGVDVRVIVPEHSDVTLIEWASLYVLRKLAARGVKLLQWRGVMMHAKTAVVDRVWSTIGSYNFDARSRFDNLEVTVEILDAQIGEAMALEFEGDVAACDPFDEATWQRLPWWRKTFAWLAFRLRRWL